MSGDRLSLAVASLVRQRSSDDADAIATLVGAIACVASGDRSRDETAHVLRAAAEEMVAAADRLAGAGDGVVREVITA